MSCIPVARGSWLLVEQKGASALSMLEPGDTEHRIEVIQREQIRLQGVNNVESFDDRQVIVETSMGLLTIAGEEFHITSLDLDKGEMVIEGLVIALEYAALDKSRGKKKEQGLLQRLFR